MHRGKFWAHQKWYLVFNQSCEKNKWHQVKMAFHKFLDCLSNLGLLESIPILFYFLDAYFYIQKIVNRMTRRLVMQFSTELLEITDMQKLKDYVMRIGI